MVSVEEAKRVILSHRVEMDTEEIELSKAIGRVLRQPIFADRDFPPFDRISMDGVAINYQDFAEGCKQFKIAGTVAAGDPQQYLTKKNACFEVMTGAIMPEGLDTVIQYEQLSVKDGIANLEVDNVKQGQNVHLKGLDRQQGDELIAAGRKITPAELGILATVGKSKVSVSKQPSIIVISNGDELVDIDGMPQAHQIRKSNVHQLSALIQNEGLLSDSAHFRDDYTLILERLATFLDKYDVLVVSGGVSKGKFDYLPKALEELGVTKHFHRVEQRPGKPFWFGTKRKTAVFALPGNPISSFICTQHYLLPWLRQNLGLAPVNDIFAVLTEEVTFKPNLTYFLQVKTTYTTFGTIEATPQRGKGSGDLANLLETDAFLALPAGKETYKKGEAYPLLHYR